MTAKQPLRSVLTFDELLKRAATEMSGREERARHRPFTTAHLFGPAASPESIAEWKRRWPGHPLPLDLEALLLRANGIHLWADSDTGRSYEGLAPLEEWELARTKMWGPDAKPEHLGDEYLAISYHADYAAFVVLKVITGEYFLMDSCGADESCPIGTNVGALLDWLWERRIP